MPGSGCKLGTHIPDLLMLFVGEAKAFGKSLIGKDEAVIWYEAASALGKLTVPEGAAGQDDDAAEVLRQKAEQLLEREAALFEKSLQRRNAGDARWLQQVRRAGTTADKVAAMSMLVQVGLHTLKHNNQNASYVCPVHHFVFISSAECNAGSGCVSIGLLIACIDSQRVHTHSHLAKPRAHVPDVFSCAQSSLGA